MKHWKSTYDTGYWRVSGNRQNQRDEAAAVSKAASDRSRSSSGSSKSSKSLLAEEAAKNYASPASKAPLSRRLDNWSNLRPSSWSAHDLRTVGTDADADETSTLRDADDDFMSVDGGEEDTTFNSALTAQSLAPPVPPRDFPPTSTPSTSSSSSTSSTSRKRLSVREVKPEPASNGDVSADVAFIIKLKNAKKAEDDDDLSTLAPSEASVWTDATGGTDTTDTTLVDEKNQALERKVTSLEKEVDTYKRKIERLKKEKKEAMEKQAADVKKSKSQTEVVRLQQKVQELTSSNEDLLDEKKSMELEVLELSRAMDRRVGTSDGTRLAADLQLRLSKAETLLEDLQEENEELKHQIKGMEEEMEEIHDSFREDQAEEYHDLKRELEQANKNCRIIQFKLRKAERSNDELVGQKSALEEQVKTLRESEDAGNPQRVEKLEKELKLSNEVSLKLSEEVEQLRKKSSSATDAKAPLKRQSSTSDESRLLRDLQDTLEREADMKEQLRFAEEEAAQLRKRLVRADEENESLAIQLKKMAKKIRRQGSQEGVLGGERDEGIAEDIEDLSWEELKIQLEMNERETTSLRKKVDAAETENDRLQERLRETERRLQTLGERSTPAPPPSATAEPSAYYEQKTAVLEEEMNELRKKLIDSERQNDSLRTELEMQSKKGGGKVVYQRSRSLDLNDSAHADLKRQMQLLETELQVMRRRNTKLEQESETVAVENKRLNARLSRAPPAGTQQKQAMERAELEERLSRAERRLTERDATITELRQAVKATPTPAGGGAAKLSAERSPREGRRAERGATDVDVEALKREKDALQSEMKTKQRELSAAKKKATDVSSERDKLTEIVRKMKDIPELKTRTPKKVTDLTPKNTLKKWVEELEDEIASAKASDESTSLKSKLQKATRDLEWERTRLKETKQQLETKERQLQRARRGELAKDSTEKELAEQVLKATEAEQKLRAAEGRLQRVEQQLQQAQEKAALAGSQLTEAQERNEQLDSNQRHLSSTWLTEREQLKSSVEQLQSKAAELEQSLADKQKKVRELEASKAKASSTQSTARAESLQREKGRLEKQVKDLEDKLTKQEAAKKSAEDKLKKLEVEYKKEKEQWEQNTSSAAAAEASAKSRVQELEDTLTTQLQEYDDLTRKYELLEEDYVVIKAQLVMEKEQIEGEFTTLKHEYDTAARELSTLRETYNSKQDLWIKEKLDMEHKVKESEERLHRAGGEAWKLDRIRFQEQLQDRDAEIQRLKKAEEFYMEEISNIKRESDEMRRKLDDYNMVSKVQRSLSVDNSHLDTEIRELKARILSEEKTHRQELSHLKIKHESGLSIMKDELHTLNQQVSKYKRERDTYKSMLEGAQRTIGDLKRKSRSGEAPADADAAAGADLFEQSQRVRELTLQLTSLEDQLSAARLEASKLRTEATTERSNWEIRAHDLQTKINELEEERIMSSGHSRISGMRARMELAWSKERAEHQRLTQETSRLADELKHTLHEVERQLENERAEAKRKVEQVKRSMEDETVDTRNKAQQLQEDLLELRDAHAKLRETLRRVLREKERAEREREELTQRAEAVHKTEAEEERKITRLMEQLQEQLDSLSAAQEAARAKQRPDGVTSPAVRSYNQVGRVSSLTSAAAKAGRSTEAERARAELSSAVGQITATVDELRLTHSTLMEEKERGRTRAIRQHTYRRSASMGETVGADDDAGSEYGGAARGRRAGSGSGYPSPAPSIVLAARRGGTLGRKSLSMGLRGDSQDSIFEQQENGSVDSLDPYAYTTLPRKKLERDVSVDRVSTGSTQSEIITGVTPAKKSKKGLKGLLKGLGRSRSIEESGAGQAILEAGVQAMAPGMQGSGSDLSELEPAVASTRDKTASGLKGKFTKLFKTPPPSRSQSIERAGREGSVPTTPAVPARRARPSPSPEMRPKNPAHVPQSTPATSGRTTTRPGVEPFTRSPLDVSTAASTLPMSARLIPAASDVTDGYQRGAADRESASAGGDAAPARGDSTAAGRNTIYPARSRAAAGVSRPKFGSSVSQARARFES